MAHQITKGAVQRMYHNDTTPGPVVQVLDIKKLSCGNANQASERFRLVVSDSQHYQQAMVATQLNPKFLSEEVQKLGLVKLTEVICNVVQNRRIIIILGLEVVSGPIDKVGEPSNVDSAGPAASAFGEKAALAMPAAVVRTAKKHKYRAVKVQFPILASALETSTGSLKELEELFEAHPDFAGTANSDGDLPLHWVAQIKSTRSFDRVDVLKALHRTNPRAALTASNDGSLPLHRAAANRKVTAREINMLLEAAPEAAHTPDRDGSIPLHRAAKRGAGEAMRALLVANPATASTANNNGKLALHHAAAHCKNNTEAFQALLDANPAAASTADKWGELPLHRAANHTGSTEAFQLLLDANPAAASTANSDGNLPLHRAAQRKDCDADMVRALLDANPAAASTANNRGSLPLHRAAANNTGNAEAFQALLDANPAAASTAASDGLLPLHSAALRKDCDADMVRALLAANPAAASTATTKYRNLPLHLAAANYTANTEAFRLLLDANPAAASTANSLGNLPLHRAASCTAASAEVVKFVLEANPQAANIKNNEGKLPSDLVSSRFQYLKQLIEAKTSRSILVLVLETLRNAPHHGLDDLACTLCEVKLCGKGVTGAMCITLCDSLSQVAAQVTSIDLRENPLGLAGCKALANYLQLASSRVTDVTVGGGDGFCLADETVAEQRFAEYSRVCQMTLDELKDQEGATGRSKADLIQSLVESKHVAPTGTAGAEAICTAMRNKSGLEIIECTHQFDLDNEFGWSPLIIKGRYGQYGNTSCEAIVQEREHIKKMLLGFESMQASVLSVNETAVKASREHQMYATALTKVEETFQVLQDIQKQLSQCDRDQIINLVEQREESAVSCQKCYTDTFKRNATGEKCYADLYSSFLTDIHASLTEKFHILSFPEDAQSVPDFEDSIAQTCNEWLEQCSSLREKLDSMSKIKERDGVDAVHSKLAQHVKAVASDISTLNASSNKCLMLYRQELELGRAAECEALVYSQKMPPIKFNYELLSVSFRKLLHRMSVLLQSRRKIAQADSARLQQFFESTIAPILAGGEHAPESRKRKAQDSLILSKDKTRSALRDYKHANVNWEYERQDLQAAEDAGNFEKQNQIRGFEEDTRAKRQCYRTALRQQYGAAEVANSLTLVFPELAVELPTLNSLRQDSVAGVKKREFDLYDPLVKLAGRCYLTRIDDEQVVLKAFPVSGELNKMDKELGILSRIGHEHVLKANAVSDGGQMLYIELPYAEQGSVADWVKTRSRSACERRDTMRQALLGLAHLHHEEIIHKDVKPTNMLVMGDGRVVVSDFDISTDRQSSNCSTTGRGFAGTVGYMAPDSKPSQASDMFSFAIALTEITIGKLPDQAILQQIREHAQCQSDVDRQLRDHDLLDLLTNLLSKSPQQRFTAAQALGTKYFTKDFPQPESLPVPSYWTDNGVSLVTDHAVLNTLSKCIQPRAGWFRRGADWKEKWPETCSGLTLAKAWHIQDSHQWTSFANERARLAGLLDCNCIRPVELESGFAAASAMLPGAAEMESATNEVYLLHGTAPATVLNIVKQGMNERFSGANGSAFGAGIYFGDNTGKTDQYAKRDKQLGMSTNFTDLHATLYAETEHPKDVFYVFVCRVLLGQHQEVRKKDKYESKSNFATKHKRELVPIPGTSPAEPYTSLVVRTCNHTVQAGGCAEHCALLPDRYSEYVSFHSCRAYPEYLVAYHRTQNAAPS